MTAPAKKTIYVDVDEEITGIIDKVRSSSDSIIALVLPKRATVFQSIVNMKLLKRSADQTDKKVVLITSEASVLPLAGTVGIHVAPNLNSKPFLPTSPDPAESMLPSEDLSGAEELEIDRSAPVGKFSKANQASEKPTPIPKESDPIEIDNRPKGDDVVAAAAATSLSEASKNAKNKNSKLKVPDFKKFRTLLIIGGVLLVLLAVGIYWALAIAPKATVTLKGETSDASLDFDITADTSAKSVDEQLGIVPAINKELKKTDTEKVAATGQKDKGNKASGTVTLKNCSDGAASIPAGTGVSSGDITFITQEAVSLGEGDFTSGGICKNSSPTKDVAVIAQNAGDKYNVSARSYAVANYKGIVANGSSMAGGTSQLVKVVSAADIETAKQKLASRQATVSDELKAGLKSEGYIGLTETFSPSNTVYTPAPAVDTESPDVTVTSATTFTMVGIKQDDVKTLVKKEASKKIDVEKQSILSDGLNDATFQIGTKKASKLDVGVKTKVVAGPDINQDEIKQQIAGMKRGDAEKLLGERPGIKEVRIDTKPFFNGSVPKKQSKIVFVIQQADGSEINTQ